MMVQMINETLPLRVVIVGAGREYNDHINAIKYQELLENIRIIAIAADDYMCVGGDA